jgi:SET domain-containing protein
MSLVVRDSIIHGKGVFTTDYIPKYSVICKLNITREITEKSPLNPDKGEQYYHCHWYPDGTTVLIGEPHCFLNHSCKHNVIFYTINKTTYVISIREIQEDEELTLNYSQCNYGGQVWECKCGLKDCRGRHRCGFKHLTKNRQMQQLLFLDPFIVQVYFDSIQKLLNDRLLLND